LQYAIGSSGFKIWKEKDGTKILNATGLVANGWQLQLTRAGTAFSATDFTNGANIAGRVCPPNVFLSHSNMTATNRCLYYDAGNTAQRLDAACTAGNCAVEASDWLRLWDKAATGRGYNSSYYEGNIKTCADKGMRLPVMYETTMTKPNMYLPDGDSGVNPTWAGGINNGVPSGPSWTWTASVYNYYDDSANYYAWWNVSTIGPAYDGTYSIRCVLPNNPPWSEVTVEESGTATWLPFDCSTICYPLLVLILGFMPCRFGWGTTD
jgi:hypothetical protein